MLRFNAQVAPDRAEAILAEHQARILTRYSDPRMFHIALPEDLAADEGLALFQALPEIEFAELNLINKTED